MNKILKRIRLLYDVITGNSIVMTVDENKCLNVNVGNFSKDFVKQASSQFFKTACFSNKL